MKKQRCENYNLELNVENYKDTILSYIDANDVISFDVFDTLLLRPFLKPTDLFDILAYKARNQYSISDFKKMRLFSEKKMRSMLQHEEDISLDVIYEDMSEKLGNDCSESLKSLEKYLELVFIDKRKFAYELYNYALQNKKRIIAISDMYLPKECINKMLISCGYLKIEELFVSSEIGCTKNSSHLYEYVKKQLNINSCDNWLHVGDNYFSDVVQANRLGICSLYLPRTCDFVESRNHLNSLSLINRMKIAMRFNEMYDNPFEIKIIDDVSKYNELISMWSIDDVEIYNENYLERFLDKTRIFFYKKLNY